MKHCTARKRIKIMLNQITSNDPFHSGISNASKPFIKSKYLLDYLEYIHQEAIVKATLISEAKSQLGKYCSELTNRTKLGVVWDMARRMNCRASYNSIPTLISKGLIADNNLDKSNMLAEMYAKICSKTNYSEQFVEYLSVTENEHAPKPSGNLPVIEDIEAINKKNSLKELKDGICNSKCNKSPGDDKLPYEFFKHLHKDALNVLLVFYNKIWTESELPDDWHHAIILPLLKPNKNAANPDSYRPISLTSTMCKIMERLVTNRLQWFVEKIICFQIIN